MASKLFIKPAIVLVAGWLLRASLINAVTPRRDSEYPPIAFLHSVQLIHDVCVEKTGVDEAAIVAFSDGEIHEDPALKCYMNCLFHETNIVDDKGEMHYEKLKRLLPQFLHEYISHLIEGCESHVPQGATQCERAWSWHVCWKETDPVLYFLV